MPSPLLSSDTARQIDADLWGFLLAVYGKPGVQAACLEIQEKAGADIVLLLVWAAGLRQGHRQLGAETIDALQVEVADWRQRAILPLRKLRIDLRRPEGLPESERLALRDRLKALELGAEQTEVSLIAEWLSAHATVPGEQAEEGLQRLIVNHKALAEPIKVIRQAALSF